MLIGTNIPNLCTFIGSGFPKGLVLLQNEVLLLLYIQTSNINKKVSCIKARRSYEPISVCLDL